MSDDAPTVPPPDELGDLRDARSDDALADKANAHAVDAYSSMLTSVHAQKRVREFLEWQLEKMPTDEFSHHAHGVTGGIIGLVIASWLGAGATPELMKEYFNRWVDIAHAQYTAVNKPAS